MPLVSFHHLNKIDICENINEMMKCLPVGAPDKSFRCCSWSKMFSPHPNQRDSQRLVDSHHSQQIPLDRTTKACYYITYYDYVNC